MQRNKDENEIEFEIKKDFLGFDREKFLTQIKWFIPILYKDLKDNNYHITKYNCKEELIHKLLEEKEKYRITKDIDHISIQYARLYDYIKENDKGFVKAYISVYFYDNVKNNIENESLNDKYWNDIWIITCRDKSNSNNKEKNNCPNCGAIMEYNYNTGFFKCNYCGCIMDNNKNIDWEIIDIELKDF